MDSKLAWDEKHALAPTQIPDSMIERISLILGCFNQGASILTLTEICRMTGLPKSTSSRITNDLVEHRFLDRVGSSLALGLRVFELGQQASPQCSLKLLAQPRMASLRRASGAAVLLAILEDSMVSFIEVMQVDSSAPAPFRVGGRLPASATSVGQVLLAHAPTSAVDRVLMDGLWKVGPNSITEPESLRAKLGRVRSAGFAIEDEESALGFASVAAPIFSAWRDAPIAALAVCSRSSKAELSAAIPMIKGVAGRLSTEAGKHPHLYT